MFESLNRQQEVDLLNFFADITSIENLSQLLEYIVQKVPSLLKVRRCSIYLIPSFVPQYTGELIDDPNIVPISANSIREDFIVLAQTNFEGKQEYIGKIFYTKGSDLTGWVYKSGSILKLRNARDQNELRDIDPNLKSSIRYVSVEPETDLIDLFPILYSPLDIDGETIGVFKLHQPNTLVEFNDIDVQIVTIISQIISGVIKRIQTNTNQNKKIHLFSSMGSEKDSNEVFENITKSAPGILDCSKAQIYLRASNEDCVYLAYENGKRYDIAQAPSYKIGAGVIGWIFKTGLSLRIDDLNNFMKPVYLSDAMLMEISEGTIVDEDCRTLEVLQSNKAYIKLLDRKFPFIGVPIINPDGSIQGVMCAHSLTRSRQSQIRIHPFTEVDLQRLKNYSGTIEVSILAEREKAKAGLLLKLGQSKNPEELFSLIMQSLPDLIHDIDCFYYKLVKSEESFLELVDTNRDKKLLSSPTRYKIGEGKTGFCALAQSTLIFDHFGYGYLNSAKIKNRILSLEDKYADDLLTNLIDENGDTVGIIRLQDGKMISNEIRSLFFNLRKTQIIAKDLGLPSNLISSYTDMNSKPSQSFIGVPIILEKNKVEGVITITRPIKGMPFSSDDIEFVQAIAKAISQVLSILELQEQRKKLYITLSHEITTYITPILADAENIQNESSTIPELSKMTSHMFGQVQRLLLMSETILGVVSGKKTGEKFSVHSIYRPLIAAILMYKDEAEELGYKILGPKGIGKNRFPEIEMRLFELTLAFKNIVHNAIKYSYRPSISQELSRFIRITGKWLPQEKNKYCISFENYGVGITKEEIDNRRIFNEFYRGYLSSDRQRTGSGIGLSYVAQVIEDMHHGKITVQSDPQDGGAYLTTFNIILPIRQPISNREWSKNK